MSQSRLSVAPALLAVLTAPALPVEVRATDGNDPARPAVAPLVESFFRLADAGRRAALVREIEIAAGGSIEDVAEAVKNVRLWSSLPAGGGTFSCESASAGLMQVAYELPSGYDPTMPHPVIVCIPDRRVSPPDMFDSVREALGKATEGFVLIRPVGSADAAFHQTTEAAVDLRRLMLEARRLIHIDTDRVFVFGAAAGGEAAWMAAVMHADLLAGAIILSAYPRVHYPAQVLPIMLGNLRHVGVLAVWTAANDTGVTNRQALVAIHNRAIAAMAKRAALPITGVEIPCDTSGNIKPPPDEVAALLHRHRVAPGGSVSRWFRYPGQGSAGWLRQTRFAGDVWESDQLSILASPLVDRDRFISDVIRDKLAYVGGRIEDQTITIETRKCARIEVLLPYGEMDIEKPVTVVCNGKRRYRDRIHPSIRTLLETAYEDWEFQRLYVADLSFTIRADGTPP